MEHQCRRIPRLLRLSRVPKIVSDMSSRMVVLARDAWPQHGCVRAIETGGRMRSGRRRLPIARSGGFVSWWTKISHLGYAFVMGRVERFKGKGSVILPLTSQRTKQEQFDDVEFEIELWPQPETPQYRGTVGPVRCAVNEIAVLEMEKGRKLVFCYCNVDALRTGVITDRTSHREPIIGTDYGPSEVVPRY
jgi:hypothetical protein